MKKALFFLLAYFATTHVMAADDVILFPANGATDVCPDTRLTITFPEEVTLGNKGMIRVFDCETLMPSIHPFLISICRRISPIATPKLAHRREQPRKIEASENINFQSSVVLVMASISILL